MLLSEYRTRVRRLLNDAQGNYWTNPELDAYINEAREKTATDTSCVRSFQLGDLIQGKEKNLYTDILTDGARTEHTSGPGMKVKPHWHPLDDGTHLLMFQPDKDAA